MNNDSKLNGKYTITLQEFTMCFVTKVTPINNIDSKSHMKKLKSSRTFLIGYSGFISHE